MSTSTILVVDDNKTNLKLISELLEWSGYEVLRAGGAEEVLALLPQQKPDLILMDIGLPGMDGLELTRKLKADPATQQIRIVALTAFAMRGDRERSLAAGCDGYLSKPIDTRSFPDQVKGFLTGLAEERR